MPLGRHHWSSLDEAGGHYRRFELDELAELVREAGLEPRRTFGWGGPFALPYYALTKRLGARKVAATARRPWARWASRTVQVLFRVDDLFPNRRGFQLICRAVRPSTGSS